MPPQSVDTDPADRPALYAFPAPRGKNTGTAVVICPGGAYLTLAVDHEGKQVAEWLNSLGVNAFVLRYRVGNWEGTKNTFPVPYWDVRRAVRLVRHLRDRWGVRLDRVGVMGFSAGGHLASTISTHFDAGDSSAADPVERESCRPDFSILIYPVIVLQGPLANRASARSLLGVPPDSALALRLSNDRAVTSQTPPTFLVATNEDHTVPAENSLRYVLALRRAGVLCELHMFERGEHGFGMLVQDDPELRAWPELLRHWLQVRGWLGPAEEAGK